MIGAAVALETERLRLETFSAWHAAPILAYYERNRAHLEPWEPRRAPEFYTLAYHEAEIAHAQTAEEYRRFTVFERTGTEVVGIVNLWQIRRGVIQAAILGYSIDAQRQGRGYAPEAAEAVIGYAFRVLRLHRIEAGYQPANERSGRVLRKLGFVVEGYARDYLNYGDGWRDHILTALINHDWDSG